MKVEVKIGDIVQKKNPWTAHNPWMGFDNEPEPALVLEIKGDSLKVMWIWKNYEQWQSNLSRDWEVMSEPKKR
jgi:hypothetical protein